MKIQFNQLRDPGLKKKMKRCFKWFSNMERSIGLESLLSCQVAKESNVVSAGTIT